MHMYPLISATFSFFVIPVHCPFFSFSICWIPFGLAVKIPGFHPGGLGSTSGVGTLFLSVQTLQVLFLAFIKHWG